MHYVVTGGTGFIGTRLVESLLADGHDITVISRKPANVTVGSKAHQPQLEAITIDELQKLTKPVDGVVNLAGAPIVDKRWTDARKKLLRHSRIDLTQALMTSLEKAGAQPDVFISGSAIGYYGSHDHDLPLNEQATVTKGFTHDLCRDWENAALGAEKHLVSRVCLIRTGVVLGEGGALKKMLPPFRFGLGGPIGDGRQWMSWLHLDDEVAAIRFLLAHDTLSGPFNLTAPGSVTNQEFSDTLGAVLGKPAKFRVPPLMMKLMLGEASELLLEGQRIYPEKLLKAGFTFKYPDLSTALRAVLDSE